MVREELGKMFYDMGLRVGAEIGTEKGLFAESLCKAGLKLYCIDAWTPYAGYKDYTKKSTLDSYEAEARERLKPYDAVIKKGWSMDLVKEFEDESLDFVYIDGNHDFKHVTEDISEWGKKVRKGGIISGHDYVKVRSSIECQVKDVVDAWCHAYKIKPSFTSDEFTSWYFIIK